MPEKSGRRVVSAFIAIDYTREPSDGAKDLWRKVADQLKPNGLKLAKLMDAAEEDVLAYIGCCRSSGPSCSLVCRSLWNGPLQSAG